MQMIAFTHQTRDLKTESVLMFGPTLKHTDLVQHIMIVRYSCRMQSLLCSNASYTIQYCTHQLTTSARDRNSGLCCVGIYSLYFSGLIGC